MTLSDRPTWLVTFAVYHRRQVFAALELRDVCAHAFQETCQRNGYRVYALAIMPDHVHLVLDAGESGHAAPKVLNNLKGVSARRVFQECPDLKLDLQSEHLWADEYHASVLTTSPAVRQACAYVFRNPIQLGLPRQSYAWLHQ